MTARGARLLVCSAGQHAMTPDNLTPGRGCKKCLADRQRERRAAKRPALPVLRSPAWMDAALCTKADPETWFPGKGESAAAAKQVCAACPVRAQCLDYALARPAVEGVWGGLTYAERRAEARRRDLARAAL